MPRDRLGNGSRGAALVGAALALACGGPAEPVAVAEPPVFRITGVAVRPLDRIAEGATVRYVTADTLRGQLAFTVATDARIVRGVAAPVRAPVDGDVRVGEVENPTVADRTWLGVDRPIRHRGVEIPANANLLAVPAIRDSFDGSRSDLLVGPLSPFVVGEVHLRADAFELAPGPYVFTFRWETATGERFADTVAVHLALARR